MQPIKELSSAAGRCVGKGCALIRQLAKSKLSIDMPSPEKASLSSKRNQFTFAPNCTVVNLVKFPQIVCKTLC